jgi:molybdate transport system substrate-binding protein
VSSQNIPLGFIAGSQLPKDESGSAGSFWRVPSSLHAPIEQDALLLTKGAQHASALQFLQFLKRQDIKVLIRSSGYDI